MRALLVSLCAVMLRIFFRRIEIVGAENVPKFGPVVFVVNHPNGLLDPLFVLCLSGRRVSLLAKEPLFRTPVVGYFVRTFECLPVYRKSDGADPSKNRAVIERAISLLGQGNALAIFPEGTSHSDVAMKPLRPGAARMALSAASNPARDGASAAVHVVPVGLYYPRKTTFRSRALVTFGAAITAPRVALDANLEPSALDAASFTNLLAEGLGRVTLQAESAEAMQLAERAERILRAAERDDEFLHLSRDARGGRSMFERRTIRQQLIDGYERLGREHHAEVRALRERMERYEAKLVDNGLRPEQRVLFTTSEVLVASLEMALVMALLLPAALLGVLLNYATYRGVGHLASKLAKGEEDLVATGKAVGGLLFFPLTWLVVAVAVYFAFDSALALAVALVVCPAAAYASLIVLERASHAVTQSYVIGTLLVRPGLRRWIVEERRAISDVVYELGATLGEGAGRSET